ncbi:MAG: LysR family transcriptional regulator [Myxococcales bacterium]|nr:LysR family transcriptional regulator [Myxococcales bacterium]
MQLRNIDLNQLVVLDALLRERSVKAAALQLALSPSATSHALARLRELLRDELLVRAGREMVLTPLAAEMQPRLHDALAALAGAVEPERPVDAAQLARTFVIAGSDYTEIFPLRALSARLAEIAPRVAVHMRHQRAEHVDDLRAGAVDLDIGVAVSGYDDVRCEALFEEHFVVVLRRGHPALRRRFDVERFAACDHVLASPRGGLGGIVDRLLGERGLRRRVARVVASFASAPQLVADSDLVTTMPRRMARLAAASLDIVLRQPPLDVPPFTVCQLWHRRSDGDAAHRWLREQIRVASATA